MFAAVATLLVLFVARPSVPMECGGANESLSECASACEPTCAVQQRAACTLQCVRGCVCAAGFIRDESSGRCVAVNDCPQESCDETEQFLECGSACPLTCDEPEPRACTRECVRGCLCKDGLLRDGSGGCVPASDCPVVNCAGLGRAFEDPSAACSPEFYVCSEWSAVKLSCPQGLFFNAETQRCDPFAHVISCVADHVMAPNARPTRGASCFPNCLVFMRGSMRSCLYVCQI